MYHLSCYNKYSVVNEILPTYNIILHSDYSDVKYDSSVILNDHVTRFCIEVYFLEVSIIFLMDLVRLLEIILMGQFSSTTDKSHNMIYCIISHDIDNVTLKTPNIKAKRCLSFVGQHGCQTRKSERRAEIVLEQGTRINLGTLTSEKVFEEPFCYSQV